MTYVDTTTDTQSSDSTITDGVTTTTTTDKRTYIRTYVDYVPDDALRVSPNPRYFTDSTGEAIFLAGSNYWNALQDGGRDNPPAAFDFAAFVTFLVNHGLNYTKAHVWEQAWHQSAADDWYIAPTIYTRPGPGTALDGGNKFDLDEFNSDYFDRLRTRCIEYGNNGIYVAINVFDKFSVNDGNTMSAVWAGHPYNASNNINSINGDPTSTGFGLDIQTLIISAITTLQEAYVEHLIDTLNDLDNIIWEVAMEPEGDYTRGGEVPETWVDYFIDYIHTYEGTKAKQHPVLQGVFYPEGSGNNTWLFASSADVISPNAGGSNEYSLDCPYQAGTRVLLLDTDHIAWQTTDGASWAWKAFCRGAGGFAIMDGGYSDYDDQGGGATYAATENFRYNLGKIIDYSQTVDLVNMTPQNAGTSPCATGYCLYKTGEYLCMTDNNGGAFDLDLTGDSGTFDLEWFKLSNYTASSGGTVSGGATRTLTAPVEEYHIAYLKKQ